VAFFKPKIMSKKEILTQIEELSEKMNNSNYITIESEIKSLLVQLYYI
jgi:hypothetical protein